MSPRTSLTMVAVMLLGACFPFSGMAHDERLDGPYSLSAPDSMRQMAVCRGFGDGCTEDIQATVIAAGVDRHYIVAARLPPTQLDNQQPAGAVEYYYIVRQVQEGERGPQKIVGPLIRADFESARRTLGLPPFTRHFTLEQLRD